MIPDAQSLRQSLLIPDWPVPGHVRAAVTTRQGGHCLPPYDSFNLALHVGDANAAVVQNRLLLQRSLGLAGEPCWLQQVHGNRVVDARGGAGEAADASYARHAGSCCTVMVADCLPLLLCDRAGSQVAAAHAGWKGLAGGVVEAVVGRFARPDEVLAWLGPAIGACHYEVGLDVRRAFPDSSGGFTPATRDGHWMMDLYAVARERLVAAGVARVFGGGYCTYCDRDRFYSYRRDGETGRIAALIWLEKEK